MLKHMREQAIIAIDTADVIMFLVDVKQGLVDSDYKVADIMSSVWAQFAHNGNPNIKELPKWKAYTAENGEMMIIDYNCEIRNNPDRKLAEIIDRHCFKQLDEFRKKQAEK